MKKLIFLSCAVLLFASNTNENKKWIKISNDAQKQLFEQHKIVNNKVHWIKNFDTAKKLALKEHKLIMVDISRSDCPPCQYLANYVYTRKNVLSYINKNFISMLYLVDKKQLPSNIQPYFTHFTPTILFFKPDGKKFYSILGARPPKDFLNLLKKVNLLYSNNK